MTWPEVPLEESTERAFLSLFLFMEIRLGRFYLFLGPFAKIEVNMPMSVGRLWLDITRHRQKLKYSNCHKLMTNFVFVRMRAPQHKLKSFNVKWECHTEKKCLLIHKTGRDADTHKKTRLSLIDAVFMSSQPFYINQSDKIHVLLNMFEFDEQRDGGEAEKSKINCH